MGKEVGQRSGSGSDVAEGANSIPSEVEIHQRDLLIREERTPSC